MNKSLKTSNLQLFPKVIDASTDVSVTALPVGFFHASTDVSVTALPVGFFHAIDTTVKVTTELALLRSLKRTLQI